MTRSDPLEELVFVTFVNRLVNVVDALFQVADWLINGLFAVNVP